MILLEIIKLRLRLRIRRSSPLGLCLMAVATALAIVIAFLALLTFCSWLGEHHPRVAGNIGLLALIVLPIWFSSRLVYDLLKIKQAQIQREEDRP